MPRIVIKTATGPVEVKTKSGDSVWICACGLTDNEDGTCSGNHRKLKVATEDPNKLYQYEDGKRLEVAELADDEEVGEKQGCCGGGCCGGDGSCCSNKDFIE
jgi:CDGSH-type Zn-finger protein